MNSQNPPGGAVRDTKADFDQNGAVTRVELQKSHHNMTAGKALLMPHFYLKLESSLRWVFVPKAEY